MNSQIGELLRKKREEKGLSLQDVNKITKIQSYVLRYLEEGIAQERLGQVYAKSFLKIYSKFLGLDLGLLIKEEQVSSLRESVVAAAKKDDRSLKKLIFDKLDKLELRLPEIKYISKGRIKYIVAALIILIFIFVVISKRSGIPAKESKAPAPAASVKTLLEKNIPDKLSLLIRAKEDSWLRVNCDKKVIFQRVLTKGSVEKWEARDELVLRIGNAGGLMVELNGRNIGPLGRSGQVVNVVMNKEGVTIGK